MLLFLSAKLAIQNGASGIIVSNHGARQLDYVSATISALEEVGLQCCYWCPWPSVSHHNLVLQCDGFLHFRASFEQDPSIEVMSSSIMRSPYLDMLRVSIFMLLSCPVAPLFCCILRHNLHVLLQVVQAAAGRLPVFLDGGVRRGTDVLKALALGASGVFVSTPSYPKTLFMFCMSLRSFWWYKICTHLNNASNNTTGTVILTLKSPYTVDG
jgi:hypothetical protein